MRDDNRLDSGDNDHLNLNTVIVVMEVAKGCSPSLCGITVVERKNASLMSMRLEIPEIR